MEKEEEHNKYNKTRKIKDKRREKLSNIGALDETAACHSHDYPRMIVTTHT